MNFVKTIEGKEWQAEFEATSDFNLHLERVKGSYLVVSQRGTPSGEYAAAFAKGVYEGQAVIDYDFGALVYPKYIKVVSGSEVVSGSVNFNEGGGSGSSDNSDVKWEYYKIDRAAFESSSVGGEIWYGMFTACESTFRQSVDEYGNYTTHIGPSDSTEYDDYYKIALSNLPRYEDYNGDEDFMDTKSPLENFARFIINMYFSTDMEFMLEQLNSFLIPITKEEYLTIDHLAEYKSE